MLIILPFPLAKQMLRTNVCYVGSTNERISLNFRQKSISVSQMVVIRELVSRKKLCPMVVRWLSMMFYGDLVSGKQIQRDNNCVALFILNSYIVSLVLNLIFLNEFNLLLSLVIETNGFYNFSPVYTLVFKTRLPN